ncbi:DUF881 domain-containing protein [Halalkalibacterium ligniniphilum]|uniref:DUF881 domain-containing protein n=1 Tax=Halalkalibacterium ligniniphilum TaxID=1134413 RepID=UPI0003493EA7|nr:DUF881 domain-containing protein [Halalkalibacterium ligniniphilum]
MNRIWIFTCVTFVIGFMLAIQFQTTNEPVIRDTRDVRELRQELRQEQERTQQLADEIEKTKSLLYQYQSSLEDRREVEHVLEQQIDQLREEAGLTEKTGEGIIITIKPLLNDQFFGQSRQVVSPILLRLLINELNIYKAKEIAIGNERIVATSTFREVNGGTQVNTRRLPPLPIEVKVLSDDPERLRDYMVVSESVEYAEIEGLQLTIETVEELTLPAYDQTPRVRFMEEVKED